MADLDAILVSNINSGINEEMLQSYFERIGDVQKVTIINSTALVFFEDQGNVEAAQVFDSGEISGVNINIKAVNSKEYLSQQPEIIAQHLSDEEPKNKEKDSDEIKRKDSDDDHKRKDSEERERKDSEERIRKDSDERRRKDSEERRHRESEELEQREATLKKDALLPKPDAAAHKEIANQNAFPELVTAKDQGVVENVVTEEVVLPTKRTNVQKSVGLGYNDIKNLLQTTNVPARARLFDTDPFKELVGNRAYLLGTVAAWSVVWVLSNIFL